MAGLGGFPYYIQAQQQAQQQQIAAQEARMRQAQFQQAQQDRQRQQAALAAAGNALPQLLSQQQGQQMQPPPPQTPPPGQSSQPMVQPGQMPPPPQGQPQGAAPLPGQGPAPGGARPPLPPFQGMPTSPPPQQAQQPASIPAPPSQAPQQPQGAPAGGQGPLSLDSAIKVLQDQGLSGADLMAGLQQLQPVLDSQSKAQAAQLQTQFNNELKIQAVRDRQASLEERKREADERAADTRASLAERAQAHADSIGLQRESLAFRMQEAKLKHAGDPDAKLSNEDVTFLAQQAMAGDTSVYQNLGRGVQGAQNIVAIRKKVAELSKDQGKTGADQAAATAQYQGDKAAARATGTRSAQVEMAAAEAQKTGQIATQLSDSIPRTQFVPANKALQAYQSNTGDPNIVKFGAAVNTFINTYARAISPTGTPTVSDKEHARDILSTAQTPEQFRSVMSVLNQEMTAARQAPRDVRASQRDTVAGRPQPDAAVGGAITPAIPSGWSVTEH